MDNKVEFICEKCKRYVFLIDNNIKCINNIEEAFMPLLYYLLILRIQLGI